VDGTSNQNKFPDPATIKLPTKSFFAPIKNLTFSSLFGYATSMDIQPA